MTRILGILNVTRDSFSDGGRYLDPGVAIEHARQLVADGADIIDVGAESTHPDAEDVSAEVEIERLTPVVERLKAEGVRVSVDTYKPAVMRRVLGLGVDMINDVSALRDPGAVDAVRDCDAQLIIMFSRWSSARAERVAGVTDARDAETIVDEIVRFFERRIGELTAAGIGHERLILDPGMGFFLSPDAEVSLAVLRGLERVAALELPVCVSMSRKSFIGSILAVRKGPRPVAERGAGTLATEIWAAQHGAAYIRTHDVGALRDALKMTAAIERVGEPPCGPP